MQRAQSEYNYEKLETEDESSEERSKQASSNILGMCMAIFSHTLFVTAMILIKNTDWNKILVYEARTINMLVICVVLWIFLKLIGRPFSFFGEPRLRMWLVLRATAYFVSAVCCYQSLSYLEVGDATTIQYTSPVISSLIGFFWLKEPFHWIFYITTILNLFGLVFVTKPSFLFEDKSLNMVGVTLSGLSALGWGVCVPLTRKTKDAHWGTVESTTQALIALVLGPIALYVKTEFGRPLIDFDRHGLEEFPLVTIIALSLICFTSLAFLTLASQMCYSNLIASIALIEIPFSYLVQHFVFGAHLDLYGLIGCSAIFLAGMMNFMKEIMHYKKDVPRESILRESIIAAHSTPNGKYTRGSNHNGGAYNKV